MIQSKVSVLIPVHQGEGYVGKAIRSILAQGFRDFEVVVLDDGSSDGSARVARSFRDPRIRVYRREQHEGVAATRNHLLLVASHPLVAWLDADDVAMPERLGKQAAFLEHHPDVALVGCAYLTIDAQGQSIEHRSLPQQHETLAARLLHDLPVPSSTVMLRRHAIDAAGGFDVSLGLAAEYDLLLKVAEKSKLAALAEPLAKCRVHARAASYVHRAEQRQALAEARRKAVLRRHLKSLVYPLPGDDEAGAETAGATAPAEVVAPLGADATEVGAATVGDAATAGDAAASADASAPDGPEAAPTTAAPAPLEQPTLFAAATELEAAAVASSEATPDAAAEAIPAEPAAAADPAGPTGAAAPEAAAAADPAAAAQDLPAQAQGGPEPEPEVAERIPQVAVVLVAAGAEALPAARSVLDQTLQDLLLVVVSTCPDAALERGLELLADERVLLLDASGASREHALNLGVLASASRYLAYLTENSVFRPDHLERLVHFLEAERLGFVYSDLGLATPGVPGSAVLGRDYDAALLLRENYIPTEAVLHRRDLLHEVGLFNEGLDQGAEWELWAHLTRLTPTRRFAEVTVERVLGGERALKLIAPSPARVRKYLSQKFSAHPPQPAERAQELALSEPRGDGDAVTRAQERFRHGDWAGAAADLVEAAARPFAALTRLFASSYPERQPQAVRLEALQPAASEPPLTSRPRPVVAAEASASAVDAAGHGLALPATPPALAEEPEQQALAVDGVAEAAGAMPTRPRTWLYTRSGFVGTGKLRTAAAPPRPAVAPSRPLYSGPSFANRRRAIATLTQNPPCPLCGQPEPTVASRLGWLRILDCGQCRIGFSHPRLQPAAAGRYFAERRPEVAPPHVRDAADLAGTPFDRSRELGWVSRSVTSGRLVDVGCSWGYALLQARALGFEALGIELSRSLARTARERFGLEVHDQDLASLSLEGGTVDAMLAVHVLQHLLEPRDFLAEAHRVLRPGGVLAGSVPNFDAYLREALGRRWRWLDPESQPFHWRPAALAAELRSAGFEVEMWTSEGLYGDEAILDFVGPDEAKQLARDGRASEIGFIARRA